MPSDPIYRNALDELGAVFDRLDPASVDAAVDRIAAARTVAVFGGGREGLQSAASRCGCSIWAGRSRWSAT